MLTASPAGLLDTSFHITGTAITGFAGGSDDAASAVADNAMTGDIIVVGTSNNQFALAAYLGNGSLDASFGTGGLVVQPVGAAPCRANAVAIDSSGRILVAGCAQVGGSADFALARFTPAGQLDTSFAGGAGYVTQDINGNLDDSAAAIVIQSSGEIILAGQTSATRGSDTHGALAAFTTAGALDSTWGNSGIVLTTGANDYLTGIALDASDNIYAVGQTGSSAAGHAELVTLTNRGGSLSRTTVNLSTSGGGDVANAIVNSGSAFFVAGAANNSFVLARITAAGTLDASFNAAGAMPGEVQTSIGTFAQANALASQADGRIVVAGYATDSASGHDFFALARYNSNGTLDTAAWNPPTGDATTDFTGAATADSRAEGVALAPDGKILAAGATGAGTDPGNFAVARYVANNAPTIAATSGSLTTIDVNQSATANLGDTVASLLGQLVPADLDGNSAAQFGLAITATDNANGSWQSSIDGGGTWLPIGAASDANALLLAQISGATANRIRFVPAHDFVGSSHISVRAWDETQGTSGLTDSVTADQTNNLNAYSDATATLSIQVVPPPVVYVNASWAGSSQGQSVSDGFGSHTFGVDACDTIQQGANLVAPGGTVHVDAGTYNQANVLFAKAETIVGVSETGVVVAPATADDHSDSSFGGAADNAFIIGASGVTIANLTIDGNANLSLGGSQNFRDAVVTNSPNSGLTYNNTVVDHVTAKNIFRRGIGLDNGSTLSTGNQITNSVFDAVGSVINDGGAAYGATAAISVIGGNALIDHNIITHAAGGIEAQGTPPGADRHQQQLHFAANHAGRRRVGHRPAELGRRLGHFR